MWEFDHFLEYGIAARRGTPMTEEMRREFGKSSGKSPSCWPDSRECSCTGTTIQEI